MSTTPLPQPPWWRTAGNRLASYYRAAALLLLNTVAAFVLLNVAAEIILYAKSRGRKLDMLSIKYGEERLDSVYPGMTRAERAQLIKECFRPLTYEDYTLFTESLITGKYVNVRAPGYRCVAEQGPWPPAAENFNIFVFGGSTTFGIGVADRQTVPSFLQEALQGHSKRRVCCYNFGVSCYFSTQERLRYEKLLLAGFVPDAAMFIDGLNEGGRPPNVPWLSQQCANFFNATNRRKTPYVNDLRTVVFERLPIGRLVHTLASSSPDEADRFEPDDADRAAACKTYLFNKSLIESVSRQHGVTTVFVWQPVPGYGYDADKYHLFADQHHNRIQHAFYVHAKDRLGDTANLLWCADIQKDSQTCNYVDKVHYGADFSKVFAQAICKMCLERRLLDRSLQ